LEGKETSGLRVEQVPRPSLEVVVEVDQKKDHEMVEEVVLKTPNCCWKVNVKATDDVRLGGGSKGGKASYFD
jgi:hypothetical protein